jgi:hypothetical protein
MRKPKTIDTDNFGRVECPLIVNEEKGRLETCIIYGIKDFVELVKSAYWYYAFKSEQTQRQSEIKELLHKLSVLLRKEKALNGRIWSPVILDKSEK